MQKIAQYLDRFAPQLQSAQYCNGCNWEQAVKLELGHRPEPIDNNRVDETVAIEAFYKLSDSRNVFLGIQYAEGLSQASTPAQFLEKAIKVIYGGAQEESLAIQGLFGQSGDKLNTDVQTYLGQPVQHAGLGVTNFWNSVGPLVVRRASEAPVTSALLRATLTRLNPSLLENSQNYTALALGVEQPEAWLGIQVGQHVGNGVYRTDPEAVATLANMV